MLAKHKVAGSTPVTRSILPRKFQGPAFSTTGTAVSRELMFATSNHHKFAEVRAILGDRGIPVAMRAMALREIQADTLEEIAAEKVREARRLVDGPVIVEDTGLFIDELRGFPGPYSAYVFRTVGNPGILRLLEDAADRRATFKSVFAYGDAGGSVKCFGAEAPGTMALTCRGEGWGYDPIFVPDNASGRTYGELGDDKNRLSHRRAALEKLARWVQVGHR